MDLEAIKRRVERGAARFLIERDVADLIAEVERLRQRLLTAAGDDLCRLTQEEIKSMSAGGVPIPPKEEFLASCERFHAQVAGEVGVNQNCLTLAQLIAEIERLAEACEDAIPFVAAFMGMMDNPMDNPKAAENAKDCLRKINDALLSVKGTAPIREEFFEEST